MSQTLSLVVPVELAGERLDVVLVRLAPDLDPLARAALAR